MELSKMFGVERDEKFRVDGYCGEFMVKSQGNFERLYRVLAEGDFDKERNVNVLSDIINGAPDNIIHLPPPLTDEQREQLKAIWTLGGRWLAKDFDCAVNYFKTKPYKESGNWFARDDGEVYGYPVPLSASVRGLQELNRVDEPYDIGKALGVE